MESKSYNHKHYTVSISKWDDMYTITFNITYAPKI